MPLLTVILVIAAAGVVLWLIQRYLPMDATLKKLLQVVVIVAVIVWILRVAGILDYLFTVRI